MLNRIEASNFSDAIPDLRHLDMEVVANTMLPTPSDNRALKKIMTIDLLCISGEH